MSENTSDIRNILLIILIIIIFAVFKLLAALLIPLAFAGLLILLNMPLINFLHSRKVPKIFIVLSVAFITLAVLWFVVAMISGTVNQLIADKSFLAEQFNKKINKAVIAVGDTLPFIDADLLRVNINSILSQENISQLLGSVLGALSSFGSSTVLFLLYYFILLTSATGYKEYVDYVLGDDKNGKKREIWEKTQTSISKYVSIKSLISLTTGIITGIICWSFGLQFAVFWGFLAFLLNFIPSIGSIIATSFPLFMAVIQFDNLGVIAAIGILLILTQLIIGNIIDPMIMGSQLKLNTVTVIFGLLFWGYIWGIPGMLLSVPLMVTIRLMLDQSRDLSIISRIMGYPEKQVKKRFKYKSESNK